MLLDHSAGRGEKPDGFRLVVGRNADRIRMNCFDTLGHRRRAEMLEFEYDDVLSALN